MTLSDDQWELVRIKRKWCPEWLFRCYAWLPAWLEPFRVIFTKEVNDEQHNP